MRMLDAATANDAARANHLSTYIESRKRYAAIVDIREVAKALKVIDSEIREAVQHAFLFIKMKRPDLTRENFECVVSYLEHIHGYAIEHYNPGYMISISWAEPKLPNKGAFDLDFPGLYYKIETYMKEIDKC